MTDPLNFEGPIPNAVVYMVEDFLKTPVASDGGWVDITDEDWKMLHEIVHSIIEAKFQRDCDNDQSVGFALCNRKNGSMETIRVPYTLESPQDMEQAVHAMGHAASIIDRLSKTVSYMMSTKRLRVERGIKMQAVTSFLASYGHIRAYARVDGWLKSDGSGLFIGKDDSVWEPLGLTCAELQAVYRDNLGNGRSNDMLDETLINATKCMEGN